MQLKAPEKKSLNLSLTPLIDVVFLLLIFFMLASTFSRFSSLPLAVNSGQSQTNNSKKFVLVRVKKDGVIEVNGQTVPVEGLVKVIDDLAVEEGMKLFIKPLEEATVQDLVVVMQKARQSKLNNPLVVR
ncbi:MAG: biopolymer transporter ExbD [Rhizobiales bacterium]|nr:biopolymer transporter ExbD [Hyphomicrobiales bacterium]